RWLRPIDRVVVYKSLNRDFSAPDRGGIGRSNQLWAGLKLPDLGKYPHGFNPRNLWSAGTPMTCDYGRRTAWLLLRLMRERPQLRATDSPVPIGRWRGITAPFAGGCERWQAGC